MKDDSAPSVYRDGHAAALGRWRDRLREIEARAALLSADEWRVLPEAWQRDLEPLRALLREPEPRLDAIVAAEAADVGPVGIDRGTSRGERLLALPTRRRVQNRI